MRAKAQAEAAGPVPTLTIAGAAEFLPDRAFPSPTKTGQAGPAQIRAACERQKVDAGLLSPAAAAWFGAVWPKGFFLAEKAPLARRLVVSLASGEKRSLVLIFFPPLSAFGTPETESPTQALLTSIVDTARAAQAESRAKGERPPLLIGLSPWGFQAERLALPQLNGLFHVLLGAGAGAPFPAEAPDLAPSLLWSRAELDGKSLIVLDFLALPHDKNWDPVSAARAHAITVAASIPGDAETEAILLKE